MATQRRGFTKEKHGALKGVLTGVALAGFGAAWLGFSSSHEDAGASNTLALASDPSTPAPATATPAATRTVTTSRTATPAATATPRSTVGASAPPDESPAAVTPRRSRGS